MSYIVCRNCKKFVEVDDLIPLNFDKCDKCGHTLEFAGTNSELQLILNDIYLPEVSDKKICSDCKSENPREAVYCLKCGSTSFQLQYDIGGFNQNMAKMGNNTNEEGIPNSAIIIQTGLPSFSPKNSILFRLFSLIIGLIDFFFFALIGVQLVLGSSEMPADILAFVTQHLTPLMIVISVSLVLAGLMSVLVIPKMTYRDSLETSSTIGLVVGIATILASKDILTIIVAMVFCSVLSGIGGLLGEFIIHKLLRKF